MGGRMMDRDQERRLHALLGSRTREDRIFDLLKQAQFLREQLQQVEQQLYDLDHQNYCYITGVIRRKSEGPK